MDLAAPLRCSRRGILHQAPARPPGHLNGAITIEQAAWPRPQRWTIRNISPGNAERDKLPFPRIGYRISNAHKVIKARQ